MFDCALWLCFHAGSIFTISIYAGLKQLLVELWTLPSSSLTVSEGQGLQ